MTLQAPRDPMSIPGAIAHLIARFGVKRIAALIPIMPGSVYRWSEEDVKHLPNAAQVVLLDKFWCAQTGEPPLVMGAMLRQLGELSGAAPEASSVATVTRETLDVSAALGRLSERLRRCSTDGKLSAAECRALRAAAAEARDEIEDVLNATRPAPRPRR